jgi:heme exporter protein B
LVWRQPGDLILSLSFFVMVAVLFPFALGADQNLLRRVGPGVLWIAVLLANLLSLPRLFEYERQQGTLEQVFLSPQLPVGWVVIKLLVHGLVSVVPVCLLTPLLALLFGLSAAESNVLWLSLILGAPSLIALGGLGAALTLGTRQGAALSALLIFPLLVPVLIFGVGSVEAVRGGLSHTAYFLLLAAASLAAMGLLPWAIASALRGSLEGNE